MKKLKVKLTREGKEHRAIMAVSSGTPVDDLLSLLSSSLSIPDSQITGFRDSEGVLLIPSLLFSNPELIRSDDYELLFKDRGLALRAEDQYLQIVSQIRLKNRLSEEEYLALRYWMCENNLMISQVYQTYIAKHDQDGFMEWVLKTSNVQNQVPSPEVVERPRIREINRREEEKIRTRDINPIIEERPTTSRVGDRPRTSNEDRKTHQKYIKIMSDMEAQGFLEQIDVRIIKALLLRENFDVMREFDHYFLHNISLHELAVRLQKLADKLNLYMERPSSPLPKNKQLQFLMDSFVRENLIDNEDLEILQKLISEENEFVYSAFDVYESDRDQAELVDSLMRAINKCQKKNEESIKSLSFYPNPPPIESAQQVLSQDIIKKIINDLQLCQNWGEEIKGTIKAMVNSFSNAVFSAFDNYLKHQDQSYLESHLYGVANSYFHLLLCNAFNVETVKFIKKNWAEGNDKVKEIFDKFGSDGNTEEFVTALSLELNLEVAENKHFWDETLQLVEGFGEEECDVEVQQL